MPITTTRMPYALDPHATCVRADVRWLHNEKFCRVDLEFSDGTGVELRLPGFSIQEVHETVGKPRGDAIEGLFARKSAVAHKRRR